MTIDIFQASKILLVDDDEACLSLIELVLQDEGFNTVAVNSGKEALKRLEQGDIDLVISDIHMPYIDGNTLLREIKKRDSSVEVILITAHATAKGAAEAINQGAQDYLTKPFNAIELIDIVKRTLERHHNVVVDQSKLTPKDLPNETKQNSKDSSPILPATPTTSTIATDIDKQTLPNNENLLSLAEIQYRHVYNVLNQLGGDKSQATQVLGIDNETLDKILKHNPTNIL